MDHIHYPEMRIFIVFHRVEGRDLLYAGLIVHLHAAQHHFNELLFKSYSFPCHRLTNSIGHIHHTYMKKLFNTI